MPVLQGQAPFVKGEDHFLHRVPPDAQTAELGVARAARRGPGEVQTSGRSLPSAGICWSVRGLCALQVPITVPLGSTQACFNSQNPCCVSAFSPKEQATIITAQVASVFHNFSAREESTEDQRLLWTLLGLGPSTL